MVFRAGLALALATTFAGAFAGAAGCKGNGESDVRLTRSGEAPAVVEIEGSAQLDLGTAKELEPNDKPEVATKVDLPVAVSGILASSRDVDMFSFVAPETGHVRVFLRPAEGVDFMVETRSGDGSDVRVGDRGPNSGEGIPNLPVAKGKTYFVAVKEFVKQPKQRRGKKSEEAVREGDSPPYQLEISLEAKPAPSEGVEREHEPNDTIATAKAIYSGDRPAGYIGWADDVDFYKLSLEGFTDKDLVEISIDGIDGVTLSLEVSLPGGDKILSRSGEKGGPIYVRGLPSRGAEFFIAKLSAKRSHESQRYRFHFATRRLAEGDEIEPNDSAKSATELGEAGAEEGSARGEIFGSDVDWFVLPKASSRRLVKLAIEWSGGVRVEVEAIVGGDSLGVARGDTREMEVTVEPGAVLRLKVTSKGGGDPTDYSLAWTSSDAPEPAADRDPDPSLFLE